MGRPGYPQNRREFRQRFLSPEACREYLVKCRRPEGCVCPTCSGKKAGLNQQRSVFECPQGGRHTAPPTGTIMHRSHVPIQAWCWAADLGSPHPPGIRALQLQRPLGIGGYQHAWHLRHRLRKGRGNDTRTTLSGLGEVDDTHIGGAVQGKKGRGVAAGAQKSLVVCLDEKSQIQVLDRPQPGLPMKKGRAGTLTHDYKRHGTTTWFAALDVLKGQVIGRCMPRHRHQEFLKFLHTIDRCTPQHLDLHCIADNDATHKKQEVTDWLAHHPRFHFHCIPTSSSWVNLVERWFGKMTTAHIRRGMVTSVSELERAIYDSIEHHNVNPKPFVWTKSANDILLKVNRGRAVLNMPPLVRRDKI
jgi:hypothetical protein